MSKPLVPCSKCKGEMSLNILAPFHGEMSGVKVTINEMPCVSCAQGHKRFVHVEFAAQLMDLMFNQETYRDIPSAVRKGFFSHTYHCSGCAQELPKAPTGSKTLEVTAELKKAQPFTVLVDVPVVKCGGCATENILSAEETAKFAFKATDQAYRSIDIHPN